MIQSRSGAAPLSSENGIVNGYPDHWEAVKLGDLAVEMCLGKMLDKHKNRGTLQPYLRNVNVRWLSFDLSDLKEMRFEEGEETRFGLEPGDLVVCEGGEPGRAAVWRGQSANAKIQKALHRIRFAQNTYDPDFAAYYLFYGTLTHRFNSFYTGTTIKHLTGRALREVEFPVPPLLEQQRIVGKIEQLFLGLDAGVAALKRARANLHRYRASVLKSAVEGRLTQKWRNANPDVKPASVLLARILRERRQRWEQQQLATYESLGKQPPENWRNKYQEPVAPNTANLPKLPDGWCWASPDQLSSPVDYAMAIGPFGSELKVSDYADDGVPLVFVRNITSAMFGRNGDKPKFVSKEKAASLAAHVAKGGDLLVTKMGEPPGTATVYPIEMEDAVVTADCIKLTPHQDIDVHYLKSVIDSTFGKEEVRKQTSGNGRAKLSLGRFAKIAIPLPPSNEAIQISELVRKQFDAVESASAQINRDIENAETTRQSILRDAFHGKLVQQDPRDEPTCELLKRIAAAREAEKNAKKTNRPIRKRPKMSDEKRKLLDVIGESKEGITPDDLFRQAGYEPNEIDSFYIDLREIRRKITEIRTSEINRWPQAKVIKLKLKGK